MTDCSPIVDVVNDLIDAVSTIDENPSNNWNARAQYNLLAAKQRLKRRKTTHEITNFQRRRMELNRNKAIETLSIKRKIEENRMSAIKRRETLKKQRLEKSQNDVLDQINDEEMDQLCLKVLNEHEETTNPLEIPELFCMVLSYLSKPTLLVTRQVSSGWRMESTKLLLKILLPFEDMYALNPNEPNFGRFHPQVPDNPQAEDDYF